MVLGSDGYENFLKTRYSSEQWGHYYLIPLTMILYMLCCHVITLAKSIQDLQFHTSTSKITARIFTTFHAFLSSIKSGKYLLKSIPCLPFISVNSNGIDGVDYYIFSRTLPAYHKNNINWRNLWKN